MSATVDPNMFAFDIQLKLASGEIYESLDELTDKVTKFEKDLAAAVTSAFGSISDYTNTISNTISDVITKTSELTKVYKGFEKQMSDVSDVGADISETHQTIVDNVDDINKSLDSAVDSSAEYNDNMKAIVGTMQAINNYFQHIAENSNNASVAAGNNLEQWIDINVLSGNINVNFDIMVDRLEKSGKLFNAIINASNRFVANMKAAAAATDEFVTLNYRLYGSQYDLLGQVRTLTSETGMLHSEVLEVYKALANSRVPREELDKLALSIGYATRSTGISAGSWAAYTKQLRSANIGTEGQIQLVHKLMSAQYRFGISTELAGKTLDKIMSAQRIAMSDYGAEGAKRVQEIGTAFAALSAQFDMPADAADALLQKLGDASMESQALWMAMGAKSQSIDDRMESAFTFVDQMAKGFGLQDKILQRATKGSYEYGVMLENIASTMHVDINQARNMVEMYRAMEKARREGDALGNEFKTIGEYIKYVNEQSGTLVGLWSKGNNTLGRQFAIFNDQITNLYRNLEQIIGPTLTLALQLLNSALMGLNAFLSSIAQGIQYLSQSSNFLVRSLGTLTSTVVTLGAVLFGLIGPMWGIYRAFIAFFGITATGTGFFTVISGGFRMLTGSVVRLFGSITSLRGLFTSIGGWLRSPISLFTRFGTSLRTTTAAGAGFSGMMGAMSRFFSRLYPVMIRAGRALWAVARPILAISASILAVTYSMTLIVDAVKRIEDNVLSFLGVSTALTVAIGILGLTLIGLGKLTSDPRVIAGMLAVSGSMLIVSAAAWLFAEATSVVISALEKFVNISPQFSDAMRHVSESLNVFISCIPNMYLAALATPALVALAAGLSAFILALWFVDIDEFVEFSDKFSNATKKLVDGFNFSKLDTSSLLKAVTSIVSMGELVDKLEPIVNKLARSFKELLLIDVGDSSRFVASVSGLITAVKMLGTTSNLLNSAADSIAIALDKLRIVSSTITEVSYNILTSIPLMEVMSLGLMHAALMMTGAAKILMVSMISLWFVSPLMRIVGRSFQELADGLSGFFELMIKNDVIDIAVEFDIASDHFRKALNKLRAAADVSGDVKFASLMGNLRMLQSLIRDVRFIEIENAAERFSRAMVLLQEAAKESYNIQFNDALFSQIHIMSIKAAKDLTNSSNALEPQIDRFVDMINKLSLAINSIPASFKLDVNVAPLIEAMNKVNELKPALAEIDDLAKSIVNASEKLERSIQPKSVVQNSKDVIEPEIKTLIKNAEITTPNAPISPSSQNDSEAVTINAKMLQVMIKIAEHIESTDIDDNVRDIADSISAIKNSSHNTGRRLSSSLNDW